MSTTLEKIPKLTKEMVQATLISEVTRQNLYKLLDASKAMQISRETLADDYQLLMNLRNIYDYLEKRRKSEDKPDRERLAARKEGYDNIMKPIAAVLNAADPYIIEINNAILGEEKLLLVGIQAENEMRSRHIEFANEITRAIVAATDSKELVRIQKLIGSEKSKTKFYGEYHPKISALCDVLLKLIDERKRIIKENDELEKKQVAAMEKGDIAFATSLKETIELNNIVIAQNADAIALDAFQQISEVAMVNEGYESESISPRLRRWAYTVDNIELLSQKMPELVEKVPNKKAITQFMKDKEESGELTEDGLTFLGLTLYRKKFYVGVPAQTKEEE